MGRTLEDVRGGTLCPPPALLNSLTATHDEMLQQRATLNRVNLSHTAFFPWTAPGVQSGGHEFKNLSRCFFSAV